MTAQAEFWTQKKRRPEYHCMTFSHSSWSAPIRLVINQYSNITLNGNVYTATSAEITPPSQNADDAATASISFPRQVVGREFKQALQSIVSAGKITPITATYEHFIDGITAPVRSQRLWVSESGGILWNATTVSVKCTDKNPLRRDISTKYDVDIFTGLRNL